jgi:DNA-directed RNA polymerase specialized sigma24 family protein
MIGWNGLVATHGTAMYTIAWRILGDEAEAEAVLQDVFREARVLLKARTTPCWGGRLRLLAALRSLDRLRAGRDRAFDGEEQAGDMRVALGDLPAREAAVFSLRYFADLPDQQIAEACQITPRAVATDLENARARLESLLGATART